MNDQPIEAGDDMNRPRWNEDITGWKEKTEEECKKQKNIVIKLEKWHRRARQENKEQNDERRG
jgi:hypothetical protein